MHSEMHPVWQNPILLPRSGPAEILTRDLMGHEQTLYRYATQANEW